MSDSADTAKQIKKEEFITLLKASEESPYSQEYLSLRARQGKLKAVKQGRNWVTTREWIAQYVMTTSWERKRNQLQEAQARASVTVFYDILESIGRGCNYITKMLDRGIQTTVLVARRIFKRVGVTRPLRVAKRVGRGYPHPTLVLKWNIVPAYRKIVAGIFVFVILIAIGFVYLVPGAWAGFSNWSKQTVVTAVRWSKEKVADIASEVETGAHQLAIDITNLTPEQVSDFIEKSLDASAEDLAYSAKDFILGSRQLARDVKGMALAAPKTVVTIAQDFWNGRTKEARVAGESVELKGQTLTQTSQSLASAKAGRGVFQTLKQTFSGFFKQGANRIASFFGQEVFKQANAEMTLVVLQKTAE
jgi:hypothetical protein